MSNPVDYTSSNKGKQEPDNFSVQYLKVCVHVGY